MRCRSTWTILLLATLAGCGTGGPEIVPVSGRVTLDGRPLENADVVFQPDEANRPSSGRTDADGRYQLMYKRGIEGARVGEHKVLITVSSEIVRRPPPIPPRYNSASELRAGVKSGEDNEFNFDLKSEPK
jgi:predicted small lipoprotein YifL